jgi:hypothetical protein
MQQNRRWDRKNTTLQGWQVQVEVFGGFARGGNNIMMK